MFSNTVNCALTLRRRPRSSTTLVFPEHYATHGQMPNYPAESYPTTYNPNIQHGDTMPPMHLSDPPRMPVDGVRRPIAQPMHAHGERSFRACFFLVLPDLPAATLHGQQHGGANNRAHHHFRVRILRRGCVFLVYGAFQTETVHITSNHREEFILVHTCLNVRIIIISSFQIS